MVIDPQPWVTIGLKSLRAVLLTACPAVLLACWIWRPPRPELGTPPPPAQQAEPAAPAAPELAWYTPLWERDLKQPPVPPQAPPAAAMPESGLPTLLATCVSPQAHLVHFIDSGGKIRMRSAGQRIEGYVILTIEAGRVELQRGEQRVWLDVPRRREGR